MAIDDLFDYFHGYDRTAFQVASCQGNEPSEEDIAAFESAIGFRLPEDFRAFTMSPLGGLYMAVREELWPRPEAFAVGPAWSFAYGIKVFGIASDIPDWLDLRVQYQEFVAEGSTGLAPFLQIECDADRYCFDSRGRIIKWDHEDPERREPRGEGFYELLRSEIRELEQRKDRKVRGEDKRKV